MTNLLAMSIIPSAITDRLTWIGVATMVSLGCDPGSFQGEIAPCVCETEGCSASACPMTVTLDQTCDGEMEFGEVLVEDHVEEEQIVPLEPLRLCSRVEPGDELRVWVRGGPWVWGPLIERCETPGEVQQIILQCVEAE